MKTNLKIFTAAVVTLGTCGLSTSFAQDQPVQQQERRGIGILPGVAPDAEQLPVSATQANNIRGTISAATEAAMTRGQLRSVAQRLTSSDEARLHEFVRQDHPQLDQLIERLQQAWQQRYNEQFSIGDRAAAYPAQIVQIRLGVTEEALAGRRGGDRDELQRLGQDLTSTPQLGDRQAPGARIEGQVGGIEGRAEVGGPAVDEERARPAAGGQAGRQSNVVTVIFPASNELPEVHVPLINEGGITDAWRIDIPLHVDGQKVHDNLVRYMNESLQRQEQWPQDVNEGYRVATHMVMLALLDAKDEGAMQPGRQDPARIEMPRQPTEPGRITEPGQQPGAQPQPGQQPR
jgi:hypothetical protein